jgi:uncharacterized protein
MMNNDKKQVDEKTVIPTTGFADLSAIISRAAGDGKKLPPVDRWDPPFCGDIDMEIRADGTWFYMGTPIGRAPLVRLFSTVLRKDEDGKTYLVTPVEKVGIRILDAAFVAVEMAVTNDPEGQVITVRTNAGDMVIIDALHPLRFVIEEVTGGLKPYVLVRGRLEAVFSRALMYDLVALSEDIEIDGTRWLAVRSATEIFKIIESEKLAEMVF